MINSQRNLEFVSQSLNLYDFLIIVGVSAFVFAVADGVGVLDTFTKQLSTYEETKEETGSSEEAKLALLADQMGVDLSKAPEEEKRSLLSLFGRSKWASFLRKRK